MLLARREGVPKTWSPATGACSQGSALNVEFPTWGPVSVPQSIPVGATYLHSVLFGYFMSVFLIATAVRCPVLI